jgi:aminopeptidase N
MTKSSNSPTIYLKDYTVPPYLIDKVDLDVELGEETTTIKSHLYVTANAASDNVPPDLELMGNSLKLKSVHLNGNLLNKDQ